MWSVADDWKNNLSIWDKRTFVVLTPYASISACSKKAPKHGDNTGPLSIL